MEGRRIAFAAIAALGTLAIMAAVVWLARPRLEPEVIGRHVNLEAWNATFEERGLPVPPGGPRDGIWQDKLPKRKRDPEIGWAEVLFEDPGRISIDARGWQYYRSRHEAHQTLVVLGGSVALGAYASSEETVYFHRLGRRLDEDPRTASDIVVIASLAWKSSQELIALHSRTGSLAPDWVIAIDGLNDVTNGSNANTIYQQRTETLDGSEWTLQYHEHDYLPRAIEYVNNIQRILRVTQDRGGRMMVVLQPALFERSHMSARERDLFRRVSGRFGGLEPMRECYEAMRRGLALVAEATDLVVLDASRLFERERATTFTDLWHFTDPAHAMLADAIGDRLIPLMIDEDPPGG